MDTGSHPVYVQTASYFFCFFIAWCGKMSEFLQMTSGTNELVGKTAVLAKETMARAHIVGHRFLSLKKSTASWKPDAQW